MEKTCRVCGLVKPLSDYGKRSRTKDGHESFCKDCGRTAYQRYYKEGAERYRKRITKNRDRYRKAIDDEKVGKFCMKCGEDDPVCLDFHHLYDKKLTISEMRNRLVSLDVIRAEMAKCVLLCANCHRKLHAGRWSLT
jgi:5-methylcytosine-specific restriction endonuclease McrA